MFKVYVNIWDGLGIHIYWKHISAVRPSQKIDSFNQMFFQESTATSSWGNGNSRSGILKFKRNISKILISINYIKVLLGSSFWSSCSFSQENWIYRTLKTQWLKGQKVNIWKPKFSEKSCARGIFFVLRKIQFEFQIMITVNCVYRSSK